MRLLLSAGRPVFRQARSGRRRQRSPSSWGQAIPSSQIGNSLPSRSSRQLLVQTHTPQGCYLHHTRCPTLQFQPAHIDHHLENPCFPHLHICVWILVAGTDQGSTTIPLASVFPIHPASAEEGGVQFEPLSKPVKSQIIVLSRYPFLLIPNIINHQKSSTRCQQTISDDFSSCLVVLSASSH